MGHRTALLFALLFPRSFRPNTVSPSKIRTTKTLVVDVAVIMVLFFINISHSLPIQSGTPLQGCHTKDLTRTICILDSKQEEYVISSGSVHKKTLERLEIKKGNQITLTKDLFSDSDYLERIILEGNKKVIISSGIFNNMAKNKDRANRTVSVDLIDNKQVVLETESLKTTDHLFISLNITNADHVIIRAATFYSLERVYIVNVETLQLEENSFKLKVPLDASTVPTSILFDNVKLDVLPKGAFPTPLANLTFRNCKLKSTKAESLKMIQMKNLIIENCNIDVWGKNTFSSGTVVQQLRITNSILGSIETDAFHLGGGLLIIQNSTIRNTLSGAFNMLVSTAIFVNNTFDTIENMGFIMTQQENSWNHMELENNTFKSLHANAFNAPYKPQIHHKTVVFVFKRNYIHKATAGAFNLSVTDGLNITVSDNYFGDVCHCNLSVNIKSLFGDSSEAMLQTLFETSKCKITVPLSTCFRLPLGYMSSRNFTRTYCDASDDRCDGIIFEPKNNEEEEEEDDMLPFIPPFDGSTKERIVMQIILIVALFVVFIILFASFVMWLYQKEYFTKAGLFASFLPTESASSLFARLCYKSSGLSPSHSANSISRVSVHEYAELHPTKLQDLDEEIQPSEDKCTQTLPEELTQELLQTLREKLDDPENYSEARDMIEHLYDLIKVEESCNKNLPAETGINFDDFEEIPNDGNHFYDEIKPKNKINTDSGRRTNRNKKLLVTVGTRAPSPEKLLPMKTIYDENRRKSMMLSDYSEPKDKADATRTNEYSELPERKPISKFQSAKQEFFAKCLQDTLPIEDTIFNLKRNPSIANRPLPKKPISADGILPSTSST